MAVDAPLHVERIYLVHERHRVHPAVARRAADTLVYVNTVVEVNEVGQVVNARPLDRLARAEAFAHRLQKLGVGPDLRVAAHARLGGGKSGEVRSLNRGVAVPTVDAIVGDMVLMAKWNGLIASYTHPGGERSRVQLVRSPYDSRDSKQRSEDAHLRNTICAFMKNLHSAFLRLTC